MDIKINNNSGRFKFRVCGILAVNNKYLTVKIGENKFYCLPGGHVELGESTDKAVLREMQEELGFEVKINKLIAIVQNLFNADESKVFHEVGYYYLVEPKNLNDVCLNDYSREEMDKGELKHLEFKWFTFEELQNVDFRPNRLIECLKNERVESIIIDTFNK